MASEQRYVIIGGGIAGASAVSRIRAWDGGGSIVLFTAERVRPYHRPPLTKALWRGRATVDDIYIEPEAFWARHDVELVTGRRVVSIDRAAQVVFDDFAAAYHYDKLLLATGAVPRRLHIPGATLDGVVYYRTLGDYARVRSCTAAGGSAVVIGGGLIGSEIAASLALNDVGVTMIFPSRSLVDRVLPEDLGRRLVERYAKRGITMLTGDTAASIEGSGDRLTIHTRRGREVEADVVIVAIGVTPSIDLAARAGLHVADGVVVDAYLRTSDPNVFAAGDIALFPSPYLDERQRIEHWDNALSQGETAGANMAGQRERYDYMPSFSSELLDFRYDAVGDVLPNLDIWEDWQEPGEIGDVYYLRNGQVRGVLLCNRGEKLEAARALIKRSVPGEEVPLHGIL